MPGTGQWTSQRDELPAISSPRAIGAREPSHPVEDESRSGHRPGECSGREVRDLTEEPGCDDQAGHDRGQVLGRQRGRQRAPVQRRLRQQQSDAARDEGAAGRDGPGEAVHAHLRSPHEPGAERVRRPGCDPEEQRLSRGAPAPVGQDHGNAHREKSNDDHRGRGEGRAAVRPRLEQGREQPQSRRSLRRREQPRTPRSSTPQHRLGRDREGDRRQRQRLDEPQGTVVQGRGLCQRAHPVQERARHPEPACPGRPALGVGVGLHRGADPEQDGRGDGERGRDHEVRRPWSRNGPRTRPFPSHCRES